MNTPDQTVQELRDGTPAAEPPRVPAGPPPHPGETQAAWARRKAAYYGDDPRRKSPVLASLLSLMPGVGQVYVGYYQHGFINILVAGSTIALLNSSGRMGLGPFEPLLGLFLAFFWLYNVVDAGRRAALYNHTLAGLDPALLPEGVQAPSMRGSLFGGVGLLVVGLVIASNTLFHVPLNWVEHWWPVALVIAGGYLIYQSVAAKREIDRLPK
jgi:TM2 domain-containing membrane protein YozV